MSNSKTEIITYSEEQINIVESGIESIREALNKSDIAKKRSLLFCLDKYLDPYYRFDLSYFDEIIMLLQELLIRNEDRKVKEDILNLLSLYSKSTLDYLADNVEFVETDLLADTLYTLNMTFNPKYLPIFYKYENHNNEIVRIVAKKAVNDLLNVKENKNAK